MHVLREVEHHRDVAALPGQRRPATAGQDRRAVLAGHGHRGYDVVGVARHDHADRHLPVVRGVGGIQRARPVVEPHLALDRTAQFLREQRGVNVELLHTVAVLEALLYWSTVLEGHRGEAPLLVALGGMSDAADSEVMWARGHGGVSYLPPCNSNPECGLGRTRSLRPSAQAAWGRSTVP